MRKSESDSRTIIRKGGFFQTLEGPEFAPPLGELLRQLEAHEGIQPNGEQRYLGQPHDGLHAPMDCKNLLGFEAYHGLLENLQARRYEVEIIFSGGRRMLGL